MKVDNKVSQTSTRTTIKSWEFFTKNKDFLANGSSTSSKMPQYLNIEPAQIVKGKGCRVWDIDGNEYIDFRNGLGPITLGYCFDEIDQAIRTQLNDGIIFGHPHPIESEVAELLVKSIPCAERVRFLKTGGEAIAACIKIARAFTGRAKIVHCGYNGWLNSFSVPSVAPAGLANSKVEKGVPAEILKLHTNMAWADIEAWENLFKIDGNNIAAVVIASNYPEMEKGGTFLPAIRKLTQKYGILMIMDEIVTGFRLAIGGAHEYFNFLPDMAVFSKGMANGMPISAYLGKAELIDSAKDIGISSTFGGETTSLAAAKATINFYRDKDVISHLWKMGKLCWSEVNLIFNKNELAASFDGFEVCPRLKFENPVLREPFFKACYRNGVSLYDVSYVNYSHSEKDIEDALKRIENAIKELP